MSRPVVIWAAFVVWAGLFGMAFVAFQLTEPTGDSFLRGLNKVYAFLVWQLGAAAVALGSFIVIRRIRRIAGFATRMAGYVPSVFSGALCLVIIGFYVYAIVVSRL